MYPLQDIFEQSQYRCRLEWGSRGARIGADRGDIVVIVDTLSFSSCAIAAAANGAMIHPIDASGDSVCVAEALGAELAVPRDAVPAQGRFSLSPLTYDSTCQGARIVLPSPNGARCTAIAHATPLLLIGTLLNATAVAATAFRMATLANLSVTVVACGERWKDEPVDEGVRFAIEDYVAAGAILSRLPLEKSAEATVCERAYLSLGDDLVDTVTQSASARELGAKGFGADVDFCVAEDRFQTVPVMHDAFLIAHPDGGEV